MTCQLPNHDLQIIKYICIDKLCRVTKKIGCSDCFLENHATHRRMRLEEFKDRTQKSVYNLRSLKINILKDEDISFSNQEFTKIISKDLIERQKISTKEAWKQSISNQLYEQNKTNVDESIKKINRMDQLIKERSFDQAKYLELASIYFNAEFWSGLAKNKNEQTQKKEIILKRKDKYFEKIMTTTDVMLRDLTYDEQKSSSLDENTAEAKQFQSPDNHKDSTARKQVPVKTRHFGTTAQKLFSVPVQKKYKYNSP